MATMIYSTLPDNRAEREAFNVLKDGPDDWAIFYSAKVPQQDSPRPREIDFVILTGVSAICLEVKGGTFSRTGNQWFDGDGKPADDPVRQSESAMYTLKNHAEPELGRLLAETSADIVANKELLRIIEDDIRFEYALLLVHPNMVGVIDPPKRRDGWLLLDFSDLSRPSRMYNALRGCLKMGKAGQSAQGEAGHCDVNPGFGGFTQCFVVLAQPPLQVQPAEGALHDPPPGQDLKGMLLCWAPHQLQGPAAHRPGPLYQFAAVGPISPDQL